MQVKDVLKRWCELLAARQTEELVAMYHEKAVLLATLVSEPLMNPEQKLVYFAALTARTGIHAVIHEEYVRTLGDSAAVISGLYSFHFQENGIAMEIPARFSFVLEQEARGWMIVEHHSSRLPV